MAPSGLLCVVSAVTVLGCRGPQAPALAPTGAVQTTVRQGSIRGFDVSEMKCIGDVDARCLDGILAAIEGLGQIDRKILQIALTLEKDGSLVTIYTQHWFIEMRLKQTGRWDVMSYGRYNI
jgi:hypothetical protein